MSNKPFELLGQEILPGTSTTVDMEIARLHTRTPIKVPIIVERAKKDGPVLLIMAGVHGDEVNGVGIVREIITRKYNKPSKGIVICIPVFNIFGYLMQTREFPDGRDLNRMFPGTANGSLASQFAHAFSKEIAPKVDFLIDFHTGGAERENASQVRCVEGDPHLMELAKIFGAPYIVYSKYISKSIRELMHKRGTTMLLFEGGKSKDLDEEVIECGVNGALNVMKHLGLHNGEPEKVRKSIIIKSSKWVRAPYSGMFIPKVKNGAEVKHKQLIGVIQDPFSSGEKRILAPNDGHIFCVTTTPIVNKGDAVIHVSVALED